MKDGEILEYHPNGRLKYILKFHDNGNKRFEYFHDEKGRSHRENNLPNSQEWYENGMLGRKTYRRHGRCYNTNHPAAVLFHSNGKIWRKIYGLNNVRMGKLLWQNLIKNI